ncbi:MAG: NADH-quinone oxidoreductase subunit L [ANME-2 cluster archaeon]|nr:NADH-quinone oxidoreductase subunit L [ANME-2 cluster archaeon]MBC2701658.1 NADH-quinone oxidoreductase subunit L [ANME-2 cluster archaeon]MBC2709217.1 NADH-quinone oxidoreductase subunit L [ANME-2 cluster archaeon]MBC2746464.1 NADH-quinone oxidoreductase subunit L [ANME-2 cluster archaeon]MBC2761827.1 NADH-quinone oxidoreductase subunit L [ANME-2 cluster archaeon]
MAVDNIVYLIPALPVLAFVLTLAFGKKLPSGGGYIPIVAIAISCIISVMAFLQIYNTHVPIEVSAHWFSVLNVGIFIDPLASVMLLMVTFVSLLIHIYAIGYMAHDPAKPRYFAETALFTAAMLGVVLADNILQFFIAWELVGLCSYLLIGFWFRKPTAAAAGKKAFLTTRVGDVLFLAGIVILFFNMREHVLPHITGHETVYLLQFSTIFDNIHHIPSGQLTIITLLFFGGAVGKSGQFPLHVWLPDAMEGPTTVSALIHAATMVTAGVYLVARTFPMFIASPGVELAGITIPATLTVVAYIGGFTALFASTMGLVMNDIKRVLAFSTISQLGYMMLALGMGSVIGVAAVGFAMFHLINHAFFKACLFLCAGSVIHSTGTNDLREMGGLMSKMKITGITMLFSSLALAGIGIPFVKILGTPIGTSGFVSKDAIIVEGSYIFAHMTNDWIPFAFGILAALLTAIYTFRLWFMAFTGKPRQERHPHESPATMTGVLSILAVFALVFGMLTFIPFTNFVGHTYDHHEIEHLAGLSGNDGIIDHDKLHHIITEETSPIIFLLPVIVGVGGLLLAWVIYNRRWISVASIGNMKNPLFAILAKRYYQHEIFIELISLKFTYGVLALAGEFSDRKIVDGIIDGISSFIIGGAEVLKKIQTGVVQNYATATILGVGLIALILSFWEVI